MIKLKHVLICTPSLKVLIYIGISLVGEIDGS